jgi:23S rRNA-/tRNA-specific pseudouridylate synthase
MGRRPLRAKKRGVALEEGANEGKVCETRFRVLARYGRFTVLLCEPRTGRLHQIRVHLAAEGFPLAYDPLYGRRRALRRDEILPAGRDREADAAEVVLDRLPLHAWKLVFTHPATAERIEVQAPLPRDLTQFLRLLKKAK